MANPYYQDLGLSKQRSERCAAPSGSSRRLQASQQAELSLKLGHMRALIIGVFFTGSRDSRICDSRFRGLEHSSLCVRHGMVTFQPQLCRRCACRVQSSLTIWDTPPRSMRFEFHLRLAGKDLKGFSGAASKAEAPRTAHSRLRQFSLSFAD